ncbi:glycoside hydrolase family 43 protein [Larkinella knui]|uniref:Glycosyl hydrolase family 43 n=1 Tax=Larkinella knui TaxID=2025310 RepID=A0A3P1CPS0_9BACT|nr:glycoside hydrolase family 43 protein [Larkinella knui]RRB15255.1 glycosyl hydrolase family 43 [Larkinella knui]
MQKTLLFFFFISTSIGFGQMLSNPLLPSGADPWSIHKDGFYYYTHTTGRNLTLWKTRSLAELKTAEKKVVWTPPATGPYSKEIWAPELHFLGGKWYLIFAADDGHNRNHRLWVLENASADPLEGTWTMKGQIKTPDDKWAIDGSLFEYKGKLYLVWSGWEGDENGEQDIYICRMENPWTATGKRVRISSPTYAWEIDGKIPRPGPDDKPVVLVNEGPQPLWKGNRLFVIYSASGCWTESYALGMLSMDGNKDLLDAGNWQKQKQPVFKAVNVSGTHAAGHNSFFKSPNGTEDWILYHANPEPGQGCGTNRSPRAQKFTWTADGMPQFGQPLSTDVTLPIPK